MKTMIHKLPRLTAALFLIVFAAFSVCASSLGNVINFKKSADEVIVTSQKGKLIITPYSSDIVKVKVIGIDLEKQKVALSMKGIE